MGQLSALHDWSALPDWLDDKHVELLPVTEEGDDRETGSPSLVTIPPSASPASSPRAEVASVARAITRASTRITHDRARA